MFAHHLLAYAMMFVRDAGRIGDAVRRMNVSPLGSCALAGTTYATDRTFTAKKLGFDGISMNSIDGVSDRDFCVELIGAFSLVMTHLSRFAEEVVLWTSSEFGFVELDDAYTTGSSIMPQKKNSDMAELVRGKTGRVYGDLMAMLTVLKGLPLAYNKDMQEDKELTFDALDTVKACLGIFAPMIATMKPNKANMYRAAGKGYINATDLADYLVGKGMPFRTAYKTVGELVALAIKEDKTLEELPLESYKQRSRRHLPLRLRAQEGVRGGYGRRIRRKTAALCGGISEMTRVFVDGREGTTGLRICERLAGRGDVELIVLPDASRKDPAARREAIFASDVTFLCLPDDAARESASLAGNPPRLPRVRTRW